MKVSITSMVCDVLTDKLKALLPYLIEKKTLTILDEILEEGEKNFL